MMTVTKSADFANINRVFGLVYMNKIFVSAGDFEVASCVQKAANQVGMAGVDEVGLFERRDVGERDFFCDFYCLVN